MKTTVNDAVRAVARARLTLAEISHLVESIEMDEKQCAEAFSIVVAEMESAEEALIAVRDKIIEAQRAPEEGA